MRNIRTKIASTAIAAALIFSPTAAVASTYAPAPSNAWSTLSTLTPAGATALAGSSVAPSAATLAGAQSTVAYEEDRRATSLPLPVIAVWLAVLGTMAYIAFIEDDDDEPQQFLTSPD